MIDLHRRHREARRPDRHPARVAAQPPLQREDPLPDGPRRQRLHPVRDVEEGGRRRDLHEGRPPVAGKRGHRRRHGARRLARPRRLRDRRHDVRRPLERHRLPDHAEGARRRLPDGSAPSLDSRPAPAGDPAHPARGDRRGPRLLQFARLHPRRHADLHAVGVRGHDHAVPGAVLRARDRLPDAERPAVQRSQRDGARPHLLLRADVPRREVEDAPPSHRVLDGRARSGVRHAGRRDGSGGRTGRRGGRSACSRSAPRS